MEGLELKLGAPYTGLGNGASVLCELTDRYKGSLVCRLGWGKSQIRNSTLSCYPVFLTAESAEEWLGWTEKGGLSGVAEKSWIYGLPKV